MYCILKVILLKITLYILLQNDIITVIILLYVSMLFYLCDITIIFLLYKALNGNVFNGKIIIEASSIIITNGVIYMKVLFIEYPKCSTCQKAKKWLDEHGVEYDDRHIKEQRPTRQELEKWYGMSGFLLKRFFNTSGVLYKQLGLKDKLPQMSEEQQLDLLATDGMIVKRPLIIADDFVLVGFKEKDWEQKLL